MATDRTGKSVGNYRNNNYKMPIILTRAQKGKQGNCKRETRKLQTFSVHIINKCPHVNISF